MRAQIVLLVCTLLCAQATAYSTVEPLFFTSTSNAKSEFGSKISLADQIAQSRFSIPRMAHTIEAESLPIEYQLEEEAPSNFTLLAWAAAIGSIAGAATAIILKVINPTAGTGDDVEMGLNSKGMTIATMYGTSTALSAAAEDDAAEEEADEAEEGGLEADSDAEPVSEWSQSTSSDDSIPKRKIYNKSKVTYKAGRNDKQLAADWGYVQNKMWKGLSGGSQVSVKNMVSKSNQKTKKQLHPNWQKQTYFSEILGRAIQVKVTTRVMRTIKKYDGIDNYILKTAPKKLGPPGSLGWQLRDKMLKKQRSMQKGSSKSSSVSSSPSDSDKSEIAASV